MTRPTAVRIDMTCGTYFFSNSTLRLQTERIKDIHIIFLPVFVTYQFWPLYVDFKENFTAYLHIFYNLHKTGDTLVNFCKKKFKYSRLITAHPLPKVSGNVFTLMWWQKNNNTSHQYVFWSKEIFRTESQSSPNTWR